MSGSERPAGETILFIDDDILAEPGLIEAHLGYHRSNPGASIIGVVVTPWDNATDPFLRYLRDKGIFNPYSIACGRPMDFSYYHTGNASTSASCCAKPAALTKNSRFMGWKTSNWAIASKRMGCLMKPGPDARARHEYFPTYEQFIERCEQAGYSLGKLTQLHPELRKRLPKTETQRAVEAFSRFLSDADVRIVPVLPGYTRWEERRGTGNVTAVLDQHYYWAIRYHFFVGYRAFLR